MFTTVKVLAAKRGPQNYKITAGIFLFVEYLLFLCLFSIYIWVDLVYCIPNYGENKYIVNKHEIKNQIAFVDRGVASIIEKATRVQSVFYFKCN